jgi:hypothetical protein
MIWLCFSVLFRLLHDLSYQQDSICMIVTAATDEATAGHSPRQNVF